jgi:deoxyribonuclease-4
MVKVGVHVSIAGSIDRAVDRAVARGCDTFQIFSRNPRGWKFKGLEPWDVKRFGEKLKDSGIFPPIDHMPYLPNLATPKDEVYQRSVESLILELERSAILEIPYLVTHLGSHLGEGKDKGFKRIIDAINEAFSKVDNDVILLLENTAGTKNSMGESFEDIKYIMDNIEQVERVKVCFDTCHAFAAGYELRTEEGLNITMRDFDDVIGIEHLTVIHLNDSKGDLNSRSDRHEHIGMGYIGERGFRHILKDDLLKKLPLILETPVDDRRDDIGNIKRVRELSSHEGYSLRQK